MNKIKRFFVVFMATLMIFCNVPSYALSKTGAAVKAEYLKTEKRAFAELVKGIEKSELGKLLKVTENIDSSYSSEVDFEIEIPEVKTRKYVVKENTSYTDRYEDGVIEAYVEGEKVASLDIVANDNMVSLRVPELYEKYITVDMSDLAGLVNKFIEDEEYVDEIVEDLPTGMMYDCDFIKAIEFTQAEEKILQNATKKYSKLLEQELLKNTYFQKGNKQTLNINNKGYKCGVVSYEISTKQLVDGIEKVWKEFKNDTVFVNLIWGKVEAFYNKIAEVNLVAEELPTKEQVLGMVDYLLAELKDEATDNIVLKSTLYHQNGKLLRRDISIKIYENGSSEEVIVLTIYTVNNGKNGYYAFSTEDATIEDFVVVDSKVTTHNLIITSTEVTYDFAEEDEYGFAPLIRQETKNIEMAAVKITKVNNNQYNIEITANDSNAKVNIEYVKNKIDSKEYDVNFNIDIISYETSFGLNTRLAYKKDIKLEKIDTTKNEILLTEMTKDEMIKLVEDNQVEVLEKAQGKFLSAFYYEEFIKPIVEQTRNTFDYNYESLEEVDDFVNDLTYYN